MACWRSSKNMQHLPFRHTLCQLPTHYCFFLFHSDIVLYSFCFIKDFLVWGDFPAGAGRNESLSNKKPPGRAAGRNHLRSGAQRKLISCMMVFSSFPNAQPITLASA